MSRTPRKAPTLSARLPKQTLRDTAATSLAVVIGSLFCLDPVLAQTPVIDPDQVIEASDIDQATQTPGFGTSVAVDGDTALIGMFGQVGVYTRDAAGLWQRTDTLVRPAATPEFDRFGQSVALDGDVAVISSERTNENFRVHIFRRTNGVWQRTQVLNAGRRICLGLDFVIENGVIAVAATSDGGWHVFTFREEPSGEFRLTSELISSSPGPFKVALNDTAEWLLIGGPLENELRGSVTVHRAVGSGWTEHQTLIAIDGEPGDGFGDSVAMDDRAIAVGAPFGGADRNGVAYEFRREGDLWQETRTLQRSPPDQFPGALLGTQVALNSGFVMVSGLGVGSGAGAVLLYDRSHTFDTPDFAFLPRPEDFNFGLALDVSGPTVLVGSPHSISGQQGVVHVYTADDSVSADIVQTSDGRAAVGGGGASNLLQVLLLAMLAALGIVRNTART